MSNFVQNIPLKEEDIPVLLEHGMEIEPLDVIVDGHPATCMIVAVAWRSTGIVISFNPPHPRWGNEFGTKYFLFQQPGVMKWGHDGETMQITHFINE